MARSVRHKVNIGFGIALLLLSIIGLVSYRSTVQLVETDARVAETHRVIAELEALLSALENAESEQRAVDNPAQQARLARLDPLVRQRLELLQQVLDVRQRQGFEPARDLVRTRRGADLQAQITSLIRKMEREERALLQVRTERAAAAAPAPQRYNWPLWWRGVRRDPPARRCQHRL